MASSDRTLRIGVIARAHGIRGEVYFRPDADGSEVILDQRQLLLATEAEGAQSERTYEIERAQATPQGVLLKLRGVLDRTGAEALRGCEVRVDRDALPPLEEGEFYIDQLIGMRVITPEGVALGTVARVAETGGVPNLEIEGSSGEEERQIPLAEAFIHRIDLEAGLITASPIEMPEDSEEGDLEG